MYFCTGECHFVCAVDSQRYLEQDRGWSDKKTRAEGQKYAMAFSWYGMVWYGMDRGWSDKETRVEGQKYGMAFSWYGMVWYGSGVE